MSMSLKVDPLPLVEPDWKHSRTTVPSTGSEKAPVRASVWAPPSGIVSVPVSAAELASPPPRPGNRYRSIAGAEVQESGVAVNQVVACRKVERSEFKGGHSGGGKALTTEERGVCVARPARAGQAPWPRSGHARPLDLPGQRGRPGPAGS
jgi:hypothetical protein